MPSAAIASSACSRDTFRKLRARARRRRLRAGRRAPAAARSSGAELRAALTSLCCRRAGALRAPVSRARHNARRLPAGRSAPIPLIFRALHVLPRASCRPRHSDEPDPCLPDLRLADGGDPAVDGVGQGKGRRAASAAGPRPRTSVAQRRRSRRGAERAHGRRGRRADAHRRSPAAVEHRPRPPAPADAVTVTTDVLRVDARRRHLRNADLLKYPQRQPKSADSRAGARCSTPGSGALLRRAERLGQQHGGAAPDHQAGFVPEGGCARRDAGRRRDSRSTCRSSGPAPNGVTIRRTLHLQRAATTRSRCATKWSTPAARRGRVTSIASCCAYPPPLKTRLRPIPKPYSFHGAAWYTPQRQVREVASTTTSSTTARSTRTSPAAGSRMLQHYFFTAWIPGDKDKSNVHAGDHAGRRRHAVRRPRARPRRQRRARRRRPRTEARLWVGPKLVKRDRSAERAGPGRAPSTSAASRSWRTLAGWLFWRALERSIRSSATGAGRSSAW